MNPNILEINIGRLAKAISIREISKDTIELKLELERTMNYLPGQYIWLQIDELNTDKNGDRRAFSISSFPDGTKDISIVFRATESKFNKTLRELKVGGEINVIGPFGSSFCLPDTPVTPLLLIAGGTGVAPFLSLIRYSIAQKTNREIFLININRAEDRVFYKDEIEKYGNLMNSVKTINLTRDLNLEDVKNLIEKENLLIYISGSQKFVDYTYNLLKTNGVFDHQFRFEAFYPTSPLNHKIHELFVNTFFDSNKHLSGGLKEYVNLASEIISSSASHIIITDLEGKVVFANNMAEKLTGFSKEEMINNTPRLWGGLMPKKFYQDLWKLKHEGRPFNTEVLNHKKNGELYYAAANISPIKDSEGQIIGFMGIEEDLTPIKKSELDAKTMEERFLQLAERVKEIFWVMELSPVQKVTYVSPSFKSIWETPEEELYKDPSLWLKKIHPEDRKKAEEEFKLFVEGKGTYNTVFRIIRNDGKISYIHTQGKQVLDNRGKPYRLVGVARDITKERELEKMKDEFVSIASHELRTPLTAIKGFLSMISDGDYGAVPEGLKEPLNNMSQASERLINLVNDMLNTSRLEQGRLQFNLTDFLPEKAFEEVLKEIEVLAKNKGISLIYNLKECPTIQADEGKVKEILNNLLGNSLKFTDKGSITVGFQEKDDDIEFNVTDTGIGIKPEDQSKLFKKFQQINTEQQGRPQGTGLGLYICKQYATSMGGDLYIKESTIGKGSTFSFFLPKAGSNKAKTVLDKINMQSKEKAKTS